MADPFLQLLDHWHENARPVCADDDASQIAWLEDNAAAELMYYSVLEWNWDWGIGVLRWLLDQRETAASAAAYQLSSFVLAGETDHDPSDEIDMMQGVAERLRAGFYQNGWGLLARYTISTQAYREKVQLFKDPSRWTLPREVTDWSTSNCPDYPEVMFDSDGRLRPTINAWKGRHSDRFSAAFANANKL